MKGLNSFIEEKFLPIANKLQGNSYLISIMSGFSALLPAIIVGSIFTLFVNVFTVYLPNEALETIFQLPINFTTNIIGLLAAYFMASALAEAEGVNQKVSGLISLIAFLIVTPMTVNEGGSFINFSWIGASGMFTAIIVAFVSTKIYSVFIKHHITIKMPDSVPSGISNSFAAMVPLFVIAILFSSIAYAFSLSEFGSMHQLVYTCLQYPLSSASATLPGMLLFVFVTQLLWSFGIHGGLVVYPIMYAIISPLDMANLAALEAGKELPNIVTSLLYVRYGSLGGCGATFGLCIFLIFFAKSKKLKALGKLALPAEIFEINEPIIFGTPLVLNPTLILPFIITPLINVTIAYAMMSLHVVPFLNGVQSPTGIPILATGLFVGGWQHCILMGLLIILDFFIYYPFIKTYDKISLKEEQEFVQD